MSSSVAYALLTIVSFIGATLSLYEFLREDVYRYIWREILYFAAFVYCCVWTFLLFSGFLASLAGVK